MRRAKVFTESLKESPGLTSILHIDEGTVVAVASSPDGKTLAAAFDGENGHSGGVILWDEAGRRRLVDEPVSVQGGRFLSLAFSPDGKTLAAGHNNHRGEGGVVQLFCLRRNGKNSLLE